MKEKFKWLIWAVMACFLVLPHTYAQEVAEAGDIVNQEGNYDSVRLIAGKKVNNSATIDGISFAAGNEVTLNGHVSYGFYAGNIVNVEGYVSKDTFVAGNIINITSDAYIGRDLYIAGNTINELTSMAGAKNLPDDQYNERINRIKDPVNKLIIILLNSKILFAGRLYLFTLIKTFIIIFIFSFVITLLIISSGILFKFKLRNNFISPYKNRASYLEKLFFVFLSVIKLFKEFNS